MAGGDLYGHVFHGPDNQTLPFTYPPFAAVMFVPMAGVSIHTAALVTNTLSALIVWCVTAYLLTACGSVLPGQLTRAGARRWACVIWPFALTCDPVLVNLNYAQINIILLGMVMLDVCRTDDRRLLPRGILTGLAAAIKLTPLVFFLFFVLDRDKTGLLRAAATAVIATAIGWAAAPAQATNYFGSVMWNMDTRLPVASGSNGSVAGVLARAGLDHPGWWIAACAVVVLLTAWAVSRLLEAGSRPGAVIVCSFVALACSPVSWVHHFVWLLPLVVLLGASLRFGPATTGDTVAGWVAFVAAAIPLVVPAHRLIPGLPAPGGGYTTVDQLLGSIHVMAMAICVVAVITRPGILSPKATTGRSWTVTV
nr:glycosyltransferase 87 family protein [Corynebacterium mendelii]